MRNFPTGLFPELFHPSGAMYTHARTYIRKYVAMLKWP